MDRINAMQIFSEVIEAGSFSSAARKLNRPQTTVSRQVKELEDYLGVQLVRRTTRNLVVTDAGGKFLNASREVLTRITEIESEAKGEYQQPTGTLTITAPVILGREYVFSLIADYLAVYRNVDVRVILSDQTMHLYEDQIDVAIRVGDLPDSGLIAKQVGKVRKVVCGACDFLDVVGRPSIPAQLSSFDCITFEGLDSASSWRFTAGGKEEQIVVSSKVTANSPDIAVHAVRRGMGLARVLSYQVQPWINNNELEEVLMDYAPAPMPVNLVYIRQELQPLKLRTFIDFIAPKLQEALAESN